jgi:FixJ family two-component response regulator
VPHQRVICIVEDDDSLRQALVGFLRSLGHEARGYGSAEEFLERGDRDVACVVSDIHLPGLNGIEMVRRLRASGDRAPVIFITAYEEERWSGEAAKSGALCLLRKPFATQDLLDCLDRAFAT